MRRIAVPAAVALALLVAGAAPGLGGQLSAAAPNRASLVDFNGDGFDDLAVGAPGETVGAGAAGAGAVSVWYASGGGVLTPGLAFTQGSDGLGGRAETGDAFGAALE